MGQSVDERIRHWASSQPHKTALICDGVDLTYDELAARIARAETMLRAYFELRPGDRVAYLGYNSFEFLVQFFACARAGLIFVPLNWRLTPSEHHFILQDSQPRLLLVEQVFHHHVAAIDTWDQPCRLVAIDGDAPKGWVDGLAVCEQLQAGEYSSNPPAAPVSAPLLLVYTSGTTGRPKGALLSHQAIQANAEIAVHALGITAQDLAMNILPMFHVGGLNIHTLPTLYAGGTVVLQRLFDPGAAWRIFKEYRPSLLLSVPTTMQAMLHDPAAAHGDLSCLRTLTTGSTIVPRSAIQPWQDRGVLVSQVYGMTESGPVSIVLSPQDAATHIGSCGKPAGPVRVRIVDGQGQDVAVGETGEIWLQAPNLFSGYWRNDAATKAAFHQDWFKTGDMAYCDAAGYYFVVDRKTDVVISGGENIYPAELEAVLADLEGLAESAVVGMADATWGEVPVVCAVRTPDSSIDAPQILAACQGRLARYKQPRAVRFFNALPRNSMGKILKQELRRRLHQD